jgi:hypothetical protein
LGFESIGYDELAAWRDSVGILPEQPIMFDFDHPVGSMGYEVREVLAKYGYSGNLFIYTGSLDQTWTGARPGTSDTDDLLTWEELGTLRESGWSIKDPSGDMLREELDR